MVIPKDNRINKKRGSIRRQVLKKKNNRTTAAMNKTMLKANDFSINLIFLFFICLSIKFQNLLHISMSFGECQMGGNGGISSSTRTVSSFVSVNTEKRNWLRFPHASGGTGSSLIDLDSKFFRQKIYKCKKIAGSRIRVSAITSPGAFPFRLTSK